MTDKYEEKYLKYKQKYLELKNKGEADTSITGEAAKAARAKVSSEDIYRSSKLTRLSDGTTFHLNKDGLKTGVIVGKPDINNFNDPIYNVVFFGEDKITTVKRSEITPTGIAALAAAADLAKKNTVIGAKAVGRYGSIGAVKVAEGAISAANTAADIYKRLSPKVSEGAKAAAADIYKRLSPKVSEGAKAAASAIQAAVSKAVAPATQVAVAKAVAPATQVAVAKTASATQAAVSKAVAPATQAAVSKAVAPATQAAVAPAGDLNTQVKSILDASEY